MHVYPNLDTYLRRTGKCAMALADAVGCTFPHLNAIRWGERQPTLDLALKLAAHCHIPIQSLVLKKRRN